MEKLLRLDEQDIIQVLADHFDGDGHISTLSKLH